MGLISIDEEYEKDLRSYGITKDDIEKAKIDTGDIKGECNHAGTTPMRMRKDALICAAKVLTFIDDQAKGRKDNLVATVARMEILPSAIAVIHGEVQILEMP